MKIAHVLTYISADGAFGGPLAVVSAQAAELVSRGHEVEIFAGWDGLAEFMVEGVTANLHRAFQVFPAGFSGLVSPGLLRAIWRRAGEFDVIHVHLARDMITMPAALSVLRRHNNVRVFVQSHGMIKPDRRIRARIFDVATRRVFRQSQSAFALNDVDAERILDVAAGPMSLLELPNGVVAQGRREYELSDLVEVLFLARLQKRKRVMVFAKAAAHLTDRKQKAHFTVIGPDEGDLPELLEFIEQHGLAGSLDYAGVVAPGEGPARIAKADLYVLPSLNEPFPMSVLESLSVGTPTVISESCHISKELVAVDAAVSFAGGDRALAQLLEKLIMDRDRLKELSADAQRAVDDHYSVKRVVDLLETYYIADRESLQLHDRQYSREGTR